jgi:hypothetical protein
MLTRIKEWFGKKRVYPHALDDPFTIRDLVSDVLRKDWSKLQEVEETTSVLYWSITLTYTFEADLSEMKKIAKQVKAEICAKEP